MTGPAQYGDVAPAGGRGATRIVDRVVAKIAAMAAQETLRACPQRSPLTWGQASRPRASVRIRRSASGDPGEVRVRLGLELGYPSDIGAQCAAVRNRVTAQVRELVGMETREVTVEVDRLHSGHLNGDSVRRVL